jgi:hypothetical protein
MAQQQEEYTKLTKKLSAKVGRCRSTLGLTALGFSA